jgi:NAD(P)-dependent dehydrogenase (short-subunit alcohol dehydrogenase family)
MLADIDRNAGEEAAGTLIEEGVEAEFTLCDVSKKADVQALISGTVNSFGGVDVCVCNAGIMHASNFLMLDVADFDRVLDVNLRGCFLVGQGAARQMVTQGRGGSIVLMASVHAFAAVPDQVPYAVSKAAIVQLARAMAVALAPQNIRVNAVAPGAVLSDLLKVSMTDDEKRRTILSRTPLGRCAETDEIAAAVAFMAGEESSYMTGHCMIIDGGRLALNFTMPEEE